MSGRATAFRCPTFRLQSLCSVSGLKLMKFKALLKWTLLVWLNAAASFHLSEEEFTQTIDRIGIVCGIFTFVIIYTKFDLHLLNLERFQLRKALFVSAIVKSLFQLKISFLTVDLMAGWVSIGIVEMVIGKVAFLSAYFITLMDGFLLSLLVIVITVMINYLMNIFFPKEQIQ